MSPIQAAGAPSGGAPDPPPDAALAQLAQELGRVLLRAERRAGHPIDRAELAGRLFVSPASLYAYLNGTTLPNSTMFDRILRELEVTGAEAGRLGTLRDQVELGRRTRRAAAAAPGTPSLAQPQPPPPPVPRELPQPAAHFVGRAAELARLDGLLARASSGAAAVAVISGAPGIGKTTLALWWAHRVKDRFPDGQLYVDLRGFDVLGPAEPGEALRGFLSALGVGDQAMPAGLEAKAALFRSVVAERRVLVVADNAQSAEQVRALLPGTSAGFVLATSRNRLTGLAVRQHATLLDLGALASRDALALLEERIGGERVAAEPGSAQALADACAGLPLALALTAARAAASPDRPLEALAVDLRQAEARLDLLDLGEADLDLRTVFAWSCARLPEQTARLFRLLGVHAGPTLDGFACAALLELPGPPRAQLDQLVSASLLGEPTPGRFTMHDLLRLYAAESAQRTDGAYATRAAVERVLDFYLDAVGAANALLQPDFPLKPPAPRPADAPALPPLKDYREALAWFEAEIDTLQSAITHAAAHGLESRAWRLAWACAVFLRRTGRREQRADIQSVALDAATRVGDQRARAVSLRLLADAFARLDRFPEARAQLEEAARLCTDLGADEELVATHLSITRLEDAAGFLTVALRHARSALVLAEQVGHLPGLADGLTAVAKQLTRVGWHREALPLARRALELFEQSGNLEGQADVLLAIGHIGHALGDAETAREACERSAELDRRLGDRYWLARVLELLAVLDLESGDEEGCQARLTEALAALESIGHPYTEAIRARLTM
ncbi:helix-turn-helix transcriptional regulator [Actinospica durhamensis]|uniref:Helix-turn-helix transcriptional regulator n=1 Tax=Actinospica durhamensis TaxID=1508375 RepID=A0A941ETN6_9ACTN|nr:helix-turn-helix transcriptional regulator [Actinospica durhamensis]MBR7837106.1 helix-turn-helix transcriptional regulator [Actinospica durhamensis]